MRIASGTTDQYVYFNAGEIGLSSFTVYRSRNGAAASAMTTPTVNETDSTNMPGVYELLLDEDMTIGAGNVTEHMALWVTAAGMTPVFIEIELFDPYAILAAQVESQDGGYSLGDVAAILLAYAAGEVSTEEGVSTYTDPGGNEPRIVGTVSSPGNRGSMTITPP